VKLAKEKLGYLHKIVAEVSNADEARDAIEAGADAIVIEGLEPEPFAQLAARARELSATVTIEGAGKITAENVRQYAEAGAQVIRIPALTNAAPAADITFRVQLF
jgi:nicotinate-nucleotide pyrophosphorylase